MPSNSQNVMFSFYHLLHFIVFAVFKLVGLKVKSLYMSLPRGVHHQEFGVCPSKSCFYNFTAYNVSINAYHTVLRGLKVHKRGAWLAQVGRVCNS